MNSSCWKSSTTSMYSERTTYRRQRKKKSWRQPSQQARQAMSICKYALTDIHLSRMSSFTMLDSGKVGCELGTLTHTKNGPSRHATATFGMFTKHLNSRRCDSCNATSNLALLSPNGKSLASQMTVRRTFKNVERNSNATSTKYLLQRKLPTLRS